MPHILILLFALLTGPVIADDIVYERAELEARLAVVPARGQKSGPELLDAISMRLVKPGGDPVNEFQLRRDVLALELPLGPSAAGVVREVATREPSIRVWHEEEGHARVAEFTLDVAAAARWVLRESEKRAHAENWYAAGAPLPPDMGPETLAEVTRHLAASVPERELPVLRQRLERLFADDAPVEDALATVAVRARDEQLALKLIESGDAARMRRRVATLHDAFPSVSQPLLAAALHRPQLAPLAVALLGDHADETWAWQALNEALEDAALGAGAAATLARHADKAQLAALAQRLFEPTPVARRAALALYLNGGSYARQLLDEYRGQARETELAGEIDTWLHD